MDMKRVSEAEFNEVLATYADAVKVRIPFNMPPTDEYQSPSLGRYPHNLVGRVDLHRPDDDDHSEDEPIYWVRDEEKPA